MTDTLIKNFAPLLLAWYAVHGRKNLPWQGLRPAYAVWLSEIMLQQTQVETVIPYFNRFINAFPTIEALSLAQEDKVLSYWSGLGYYARARNLHKTAKIIVQEWAGKWPEDLNTLMLLPGIGQSTAAAILSLAFNQKTAILDANVVRVLSRCFTVAGIPSESAVKKKLWELAHACMPDQNCGDYTQAIMDLGATCCTKNKPNCLGCPLNSLCLAYKNKQVQDYPYPKIKKIIPKKKQQFLLLYTKEQKIYLEKRPPVGLWGGLWCLPVLEEEQCPLSFINDTLQLSCSNQKHLMTLKHSFSHFHLEIKAWSFLVSNTDIDKNHSRTYTLREPKGHWFKALDCKDLGLAKPVNSIISHFFST